MSSFVDDWWWEHDLVVEFGSSTCTGVIRNMGNRLNLEETKRDTEENQTYVQQKAGTARY